MIWIINYKTKAIIFVKQVKVVKDGVKYYLAGDKNDRISEDMDEAAANNTFRRIVSAIRANAQAYITINEEEDSK